MPTKVKGLVVSHGARVDHIAVALFDAAFQADVMLAAVSAKAILERSPEVILRNVSLARVPHHVDVGQLQ